MTVEKRHCNGVGTTHGGAIVTLADFAFAAACNSHGTVAVAININSSFYKATRPGDVLTAEASEDTRNPKLGSYAIRVTDGEGDLVAGFQAMAYRKKNPLPLDI
jgi:acyl-CoA thioesterase